MAAQTRGNSDARQTAADAIGAAQGAASSEEARNTSDWQRWADSVDAGQRLANAQAAERWRRGAPSFEAQLYRTQAGEQNYVDWVRDEALGTPLAGDASR